ncbi:MAG: ABC transporter ATP-binding protein [Granulosicoccus sp.]
MIAGIMEYEGVKPVLDVQIAGRSFPTEGGESLQALADLSFSLMPDTVTCIVGPSGCGKTTTLRAILGLDQHYDGTITQPGSERLAAVFQEPRLLPWRTVEQNVRLVLPEKRLNDSLDELFEQLGIAHVRGFYPNQLSLGLARRVSLARAFVLQPELLVLDEPFVSLDESTATRLRLLLVNLLQTHRTTTLMVTHNVNEAAQLADRILVFSERPATIVGEVAISVARPDRDLPCLESVAADVAALQQL